MAAYTDKIDRVFELCAQLGFTERDYARMSVAAADQAMVKVSDQDEIAHLCGLDPADAFAADDIMECDSCGATEQSDCACRGSEPDSIQTLGLGGVW